MSQMPDSIYLHKDSKYNTAGIFSAYDDDFILAENDFDEKSLEDYVEYIPIYRKEEAIRDVKKDLGWVSVKDRLPEKEGWCLVHLKEAGFYYLDYYYKSDGSWAGDEIDEPSDVDYWMPIPELPTK